MSVIPGLIHARHLRDPEFKHIDSIVRPRDSATFVSTANTILSPSKQFNTLSNFRTSPMTTNLPDTTDARNSSISQNLLLSEIDPVEVQQTEIIPITDLYNIPVPSHRRNRTEIPNISLRDMEASTIRQSSQLREVSLNVSKSTQVLPRIANNSVSVFRSPTSRKTPISLSIHVPNDDVKFEHYLEYLHLNSNKNELRKNFEARSVSNKKVKPVFSALRSETIKLDNPVVDPGPISLIKINLKSSSPRKEGPSFKNVVTKLFPTLKDVNADGLKGDSVKKISNENSNSNTQRERKTHREVTIMLDQSEPKTTQQDMNSPTSMMSTPMGQNSPAKLMRSNSRSPFKTRIEKWHNEYERLLTNLAKNLESLAEKVQNDQKMESLLDKFCERNKVLFNLLNKPQGKQLDFNADRAIRRFRLIEFGPEPTFVPLRIKKKKMGVTFINPELIPNIEKIGQGIEDYLIKIRKAEMKMVEDHLLKAELKLDQIHKKKFKEMKVNGKIKEFIAAQRILDNKPRIDPFYFYKFDPVKELQEFKNTNNYADTTYINPKNLEHAKTLSEVFENWTSLINKKIHNPNQ